MSQTRGFWRLWLALSAIALLVVGAVPALATARESTCPDLIKPQAPVPATSAAASSAGVFAPVDNTGSEIDEASLAMDFGTSRSRDVRTQTYRVSSAIDPDTVRVSTVNDIVRNNDPLPIANGQLTYRAGKSSSTGLVNVRVCYDPGGPHEPAAGRYVGALLVSAPGAKATPLSLELTFRDDQVWKAIVALVVGILAGAVVQAIAMFQQAPQQRRPSSPWPYIFNFRTLISVGTGVVAALSAYGKLVEGDPTWDGTGTALLALAGATFGATLAAKTAVDLKGPTSKEKTKGLAARPQEEGAA
jgi:hypothetical protein